MTQVIQQPKCPRCGGMVTQKFQAWQILVAILLFPWGLIALAVPRKWKCTICGNWASKEEIAQSAMMNINNSKNYVTNDIETNKTSYDNNTGGIVADEKMQNVLNALYKGFNAVEKFKNTIYENLGEEDMGMSVYDIGRKDLIELLLNLSLADGAITQKDLDFIHIYFDYDLSQQELEYIKEKHSASDFTKRVPDIFNIFKTVSSMANVDNKFINNNLKAYKVFAEQYMKITNHKAVVELNEYISNIAEYIENN